MRRGKSVSRERTLDQDEIRAVWKAADQMGTYGAILKTLLLTTQRRAKVATMKWDDLDGDEWTIATQEREKGNAGTLRLPQMALDIINAQPRLAYNPFLFGAATGKGHLNSWTQRKGEIDAKLPRGMPDWTLHDLRRTARSLMADCDVVLTSPNASSVMSSPASRVPTTGASTRIKKRMRCKYWPTGLR
jgi:integrase